MTDSKDWSVTIREMRAEDALRVSALTSELGYERTAEEIRGWMEQRRSDQAAFVACLNGEVVGWIEVAVERRVQSDPFALIGGLVVSRQARGGRIGRQLCERAEAWSWEQGVATVRVTSRSTRVDAHRFYLRNGYETVKTSMVFEKKGPQRKRP
jgi:GNAT superfamily N-acetyltransferase